MALPIFWSAAFARKSSPLHRNVGKVYLWAMWVILGTAAPMAALAAHCGKPGIATFLFYLLVIPTIPVWLSRRAVRLKRERERSFDVRFRWVGLVPPDRHPAGLRGGRAVRQRAADGFLLD